MPREKKPAAPNGSAVRKLAPAIPLAIALLHGALTQHPAPTAPPPPVLVSAPFSGSVSGTKCGGGTPDSPPCKVPLPMLAKGHPVDWWFVFKLNLKTFPGCGGGVNTCPFGGTDMSGPKYPIAQQFLFASSEKPTLAKGGGECTGATTDEPVGATFDEVYNGSYHYVVWNDQFHDVDPPVQGCTGGDCGAPWGHSKGLIAWNDDGDGLVMQVSTPSWPGSGSTKFERKIGNTLGCVDAPDDVKVSQHFFALRLTKPDLMAVLRGLQEASVVTDTTKDSQTAQIGGPSDVVQVARALGTRSTLATIDTTMPVQLSTHVQLIAKPSGLHVPPWQLVSSLLGGVSLRTANWWEKSSGFASTTGGAVGCWDDSLKTPPGAVEIALHGHWKDPVTGTDTVIGLGGGNIPDGNHAKIGVSTSGSAPLTIFGDMNQEGALSGDSKACGSSQNGRGGLFFVLDNAAMAASVADLIAGDSVSTTFVK